MFTESPSRRTVRSTIRSTVREMVSVLDAVAAPHGIDRHLEQIAPLWSTTEIRGRVVAVDRTAVGSTILTIKPNGNWAGFKAGQYTQLSVEIDGVRHTRCYSMANSASDTGTFQLGIKAHPHGLVSRHLLREARVGLVVGLSAPAGDFHLPDVRPDGVLLISGGSGITPVLSMLRTLVAEGHAGPISFVHYAPSPDAVLFSRELAAIAEANDNVQLFFGFDTAPHVGQLVGFLDTDHLDTVCSDWATTETFVCGPAPLMDSVAGCFDAAGATERFHQEAFTLPHFVSEAGTVDGSIRFGTSDLVIENDGRPILEQAEDAGLEPDSGCRMGICHTCTRSMTCGTVRDAVSGEVTSGTNVEIRVCVSVPVGDIEIEL